MSSSELAEANIELAKPNGVFCEEKQLMRKKVQECLATQKTCDERSEKKQELELEIDRLRNLIQVSSKKI